MQGYWTCDMSDITHEGHVSDHGGKCILDMTKGEHSKYEYGLGCRQCDFDICLKCLFNKKTVKEI